MVAGKGKVATRVEAFGGWTQELGSASGLTGAGCCLCVFFRGFSLKAECLCCGGGASGDSRWRVSAVIDRQQRCQSQTEVAEPLAWMCLFSVDKLANGQWQKFSRQSVMQMCACDQQTKVLGKVAGPKLASQCGD